jgi:hypothetical protein
MVSSTAIGCILHSTALQAIQAGTKGFIVICFTLHSVTLQALVHMLDGTLLPSPASRPVLQANGMPAEDTFNSYALGSSSINGSGSSSSSASTRRLRGERPTAANTATATVTTAGVASSLRRGERRGSSADSTAAAAAAAAGAGSSSSSSSKRTSGHRKALAVVQGGAELSDYQASCAKQAILWGGVAIGALLLGSPVEGVQKYVALAEAQLKECFDACDEFAAGAYMMLVSAACMCTLLLLLTVTVQCGSSATATRSACFVPSSQ